MQIEITEKNERLKTVELNNKEMQKKEADLFKCLEDKAVLESIENEMLEGVPKVAWDAIGGLADAKRLLNEAVVLPLLAVVLPLARGGAAVSVIPLVFTVSVFVENPS